MKINILNKISQKLLLAMLAFALVFMSACEELDFPDPNSPILDNVNVQQLVSGIESGMRNQLNVYILVTSVIGREAYNFDPADPAWTDEVIYGPLDPGGFIVNNPWQERYRVILNCRDLVEKASGDAGAQGFAKTIQAYQLLLNLNLLWDNGIKLNYDGVLDNFSSRDAAFTEIARLLDSGAGDLAGAGSFSFSLSGGFAGFDTPATFRQFNRALRARVAVYMGQYQIALDALAESFLNETGDMATGVYHVYGTGLGDQTNPIFENPEASFVKFRAHPSFQSDAEANDARFANKVVDRSTDGGFIPVFGTTELSSAYPISIVDGPEAPYPIIRNEELILLRAEANIGLGNAGLAEGDMNIVRSVAGVPDYTDTENSNALTRLLHEKRYSLFGEGHRWIDMRRYGLLDQLPLDRVGDPVRPDDVIHVQFPRPQSEVSGG